MHLATRLISSLALLAPLALPAVARPSALRHHHQPRALIDVCAYIDADLVISKLGVLGLLPNVASAVANLDLCLCASAFPLNIQDYTSLSVLASILGDDEVTALLTALINDGPGSTQCTYPAHSSALCSQSDPCGFTCGSGYVVQGDQCVCPPPLSEKNGQCGTFPQGSSTTQTKRAAIIARGVRDYDEALSTCKKGESVCGVHTGGSGYECLNTDTALDSCGGCINANPFLSVSEQTSGVDCSQLPNVSGVSCEGGKCAVQSCDAGYEVASSLDSCVKVSTGSKRTRTKRSSRTNRSDVVDVSSTATATVGVSAISSATSSSSLDTTVSLGSLLNGDGSCTLDDVVNAVVDSLNDLGLGGDSDDVASALNTSASLSSGSLTSDNVAAAVATILNDYGLGNSVDSLLAALGLSSDTTAFIGVSTPTSASTPASVSASITASASGSSATGSLLGGLDLGTSLDGLLGSDSLSLSGLNQAVSEVLNGLGLGTYVNAVVAGLNDCNSGSSSSGSSSGSLDLDDTVDDITNVLTDLGLDSQVDAVLNGLGLTTSGASSNSLSVSASATASVSGSASVPTTTASSSLIGSDGSVDGLVTAVNNVLNNLGLGSSTTAVTQILNGCGCLSSTSSSLDLSYAIADILADLGLDSNTGAVLDALNLPLVAAVSASATASASVAGSTGSITKPLLSSLGLSSTDNISATSIVDLDGSKLKSVSSAETGADVHGRGFGNMKLVERLAFSGAMLDF